MLLSLTGGHLVAATETGGRILPPPSIYMPQGGSVVADINVKDDDVLGIIKQAIPILGEAIRCGTKPADGELSQPPLAKLQALDFTGLIEAISGIRAIRLVVLHYDKKIDLKALVGELDRGAAKSGEFRKVASDCAFAPGTVALYAQPDNSGYLGFAYQREVRQLLGFRIVGAFDAAKLTKWAMDAASVITQK